MGRGGKAALALVEHDRDSVGAEIGRHEILVTVAVHITRGNPTWPDSRSHGRACLKNSMAVVDKDTDGVGVIAGDSKVAVAVAIEVRYHHLNRAGSRDNW